MQKAGKAKYYLTLLTAIMAFFLSVYSLLAQGVYTARINRITSYELMGQDVVTAMVSAVFVYLVVGQDYARLKIKIAWLGCLLYLFYIYAYFSFGGVTSVFYLLYLVITSLALFLFFFVLVDIIQGPELPQVARDYPRKVISLFLLASILLVGGVEIQELVMHTIIQREPLNPFYVFYVLDLALIFPLIGIAAMLNWARARWGYVLSGVALVKIVTVLPAVIFNDLFHRLYVGVFLDLTFDLIALVITLIGVMLLVLYMHRIEGHKQSGR